MRSQPYKVEDGESRTRSRVSSRRRSRRAEVLRSLAVESLESRTLLSVLPTSTTTSPVDISGQPSSTSNESTPSIAVDPNNPQKLAAVWTRNDPSLAPAQTEIVQGATSNDGGKVWTAINVGNFIVDPSSSPTSPVPYPQASNASVAFDRSDNVYFLYQQHKTDNSYGALLLTKYSFTQGTPAASFTNHIVYQYGDPQAYEPTLAVDQNLPTFSDTDSNGVARTQNDPNSGDVYVAFATVDTSPAGNPQGTNYNPNRVLLYTSTDGGQSFSTFTVASDNGATGGEFNTGNSGAGHYTSPSITISQGSAPRPAGTDGTTDKGTAGVPAGQVSISYDDFGTFSTASPPLTQIDQERITGGTWAQTFNSATGVIQPGGPGTPNVPAVSNFTIPVNITSTEFKTVSNVTLTLALLHPSLAELSVVLIPPSGSGLSSITLFANQTDAAGNTNTGVGISGANLGIAPVGELMGTIFSDYATRDIVDINPFTGARGASAPFLGYFEPEAGSFVSDYKGAIAGAANSANSVNGNWTIQVTDFRNSTPTTPNELVLGKLTISSGFVAGVDSPVALTSVMDVAPALIPIYPTKSAADLQGVGPNPVMASDNTLGAYSQFEGRLYISYVDRNIYTGNPTDNTDVMLSYSDDGGITWSVAQEVNDDVGASDGFSEGPIPAGETSTTGTTIGVNAITSGRAQFQPSIAVDPATGTLVLSWFDTRYDASRARVATETTTSIDGSATFSPDIYANVSQTATDAITGKAVNLGPVPDNESSGNALTEGTVGFGQHQGLAVYGGQIHVIWASNQNGGTPSPATNTLDIRVGNESFADGPRVIASTMGPVGNAGDTINSDRATDGTPTAEAFQVTFDRWVDPATFLPNDVKVLYRDTTTNDLTGGLVPVTSIVPVNLGLYGATVFQVNFAPRNGVGTYSYTIAPTVADRIRSTASAVTPVGSATTFSSSNVPIAVPASSTITSTLPINTFPAGEVVDNVTVNLTITAGDASGLVLTLIAPDGTRILLASHEPFTFAGGQNYTNTTFSDAATTPIGQGLAPFTGSFQPLTQLANLINHGINGTWRLQVQNALTPLAASLVSWSLNLTGGVAGTVSISGNAMDQNANGKAGQTTDFYAAPQPLSGTNPFAGPYNTNTLPLILPGPTIVSSTPTGSPATSDNLALNKTVSSIDVVFDRNMNPATITPATILSMIGPTGSISGPFTVKANPTGSDPDPNFPITYRIGFPTQTISGTYTLKFASTITDANGNALDTNQNAAVALLEGTPSATSTPVTYTYSGPTVAIKSTQTVLVPLNVPDNFTAEGVTVQVNIAYANDPDLSITLLSPTNVPVQLVAFGTGATGSHANFSGTIFSDSATTPIANGGPPFFGSFIPAAPLSGFNGSLTQGLWHLEINDNPTATDGTSGTLSSFSITFQKSIPISGLGEPVADQGSASFRIFTQSPTNAQSSTTWTAVGPASAIDTGSVTNNGFAGSVTAIAVDPSDPSGNTVFAGGAGGGVWKTTDFLTSNVNGPTWVPLTDFGPTSGINIGSISIFTKNNDPNQSIIIAGTGDNPGSTSASSIAYGNSAEAQGVGFLRSTDGGKTWALLDSTNNSLPYASRDHLFAASGGTATEKVIVDPNPEPNGQVIVYAAMSGPNGGLWRSLDAGTTWTLMSSASVQGDNATDVVLDYASATVNAVSNPTGNVNVIYAAFAGTTAGGTGGVYISPNRGQVLNPMTSLSVTPLIYDTTNGPHAVPLDNVVNPISASGDGKIVLAKPSLIPSTQANADIENTLYEGWLYAAVNNNGVLQAVYLTKDNGQTWTQLQLNGMPDTNNVLPVPATPSDDETKPSYDPVASPSFQHAYYNLTMTVDPSNPEIVYLGGTQDGNQSGLIRIDVSGVYDSHAVVGYDNSRNDGGTETVNSTGRTPVVDNIYANPTVLSATGVPLGQFTNVIENPSQPFSVNTTVDVYNVASFTNDGSGVKWTPIDQILKANAADQLPSSNTHVMLSMVDPVTGQTRLIVGDDQGVFTGTLTAAGAIDTGIGTDVSATYSRNGNLQLAQDNYGAAQPSNTLVNSQVASALYYGNGLGLGLTASDPNVLTNGDIIGQGSTNGSPLGPISASSADQAGVGVQVDQQGNNIVYRYYTPEFGGNKTDFFQVSIDGGPFISRTTGLVQAANDPQWPAQDVDLGNGVTVGNFTINPLNSSEILIGSAAGRVFSTINQGESWLSIAEPSALDGTYTPALTYGAPDPSAPGGIGNLNNFVYAGTVGGHIYVSQTGGGATANAWINVSTGLDGSPVMQIVTDPTRGSHDAYAVTQKGVYYIANSLAANATWTNISSNLFSLTNVPFGNAAYTQTALNFLNSIQADWRYVIPNAGKGATGTHPVLYVAGDGGVFRSLDNGTTWTVFPSIAVDGAPADGGYLPNADVTDLTLSTGKIDPTTGRAIAVAGDPNTLLATTYGRGQFVIRLAPIVFTTVTLDPKLPAPSGSAGGGTDASGYPIVTTAQPVFDGTSEQSAFGNTVFISILDLTDPANPHIIGGYDPSNPATAIAANETTSTGTYSVQVNANGFTTTGVKVIGIQATDASGLQGNIAKITIDLQAKLITKNPPAIPTIGLNPADDSSGGKDVTNDSSPHVIGVTDPAVQVQLFEIITGQPSILIGTTTTNSQGDYSVQFPTSPDGSYTVQAVATNAYGSTTSATFTFQIKTTKPTTVPTLSLSPADDTGIKGDNLTSARTPHFVGQADPNETIRIYQVIGGVRSATVLATTTADTTGHYSIQLPNALNNGQIILEVGSADVAGNLGPYSLPLGVVIATTPGDYTDAGKTTPATFVRTTAGNLVYYIQGVPPATGTAYGSATLSVPFQGDFDGDGKDDLAYYNPSTETWSISRSTLGPISFPLGTAGSVPVVGDFDGDLVTDVGAFVPATGQWTLAESKNGTQVVTFPSNPQAGDIPVPGNYDKTGKSELAVYRPSTGQWIIQGPNGQYTVNFGGAPGDIPVPGAYTATASNHSDTEAIYRPSTGQYFIHEAGGNVTLTFALGSIPAPGDYDGTGVTEAAAYYQPNSTFYIAAPGQVETVAYGPPSGVPLNAPLTYRNVIAKTPTLTLAAAADTGIKGDGITTARTPLLTGTTDPGALVDLLLNGVAAGSGVADGNGNFSITLSPNAPLTDGTYSVTAVAHVLGGTVGPTSSALTLKVETVNGDYIGNGTTQPALFVRVNAGAIAWYAYGSSAVNGKLFGAGSLDVPVAGDFDGDGKDDLAVFRPSTGQWFSQLSGSNYAGQVLVTLGMPGDIPVPANYNGPGVTVPAVYRPSTGQWFIEGKSAAITLGGRSGDVPVPGDYDNTGSDELAIYRPSTGQWIIEQANGATHNVTFGGSGYVPAPGAYNATATNHSVEEAIYNPTTGLYLIDANNTTVTLTFPTGGIPAPGDYQGTGVTEAAVYVPGTGKLYIAETTGVQVVSYGGTGFVPTLAPYQYRAVGSSGGGITTAAISTGTPVDLGGTAHSLSSGTTATSPVTTRTTPTPPVSVTVAPSRPAQKAAAAKQEKLTLLKAKLASIRNHHLVNRLASLTTKKTHKG